MAKKRSKKRRSSIGSSDRFVVSGPPRWRRSVHTSYNAAIQSGHKCSRDFPNAVCRVEQGLPGMQRTVAECNRNECYQLGGGVGRRRRRKARR